MNGLSYFLSERFWLKRTTDDWSGRRMVWRTGVNGALYNRPQFTCTPTRVGDFVSGSVNHKFQEISGNYLNLTYLTWLLQPSPSSRRTPASTRYWSNAGLMLGQRRRRWAQHQSQHCLKRSLIRGGGGPAKKGHWQCVGSMLAHRQRRWATIETTQRQGHVFAGGCSWRQSQCYYTARWGGWHCVYTPTPNTPPPLPPTTTCYSSHLLCKGSICSLVKWADTVGQL